jgi:hypothetical protein
MKIGRIEFCDKCWVMESVKNRLAGKEQMKTITEKKTEDANDLLDEMIK